MPETKRARSDAIAAKPKIRRSEVQNARQDL